MLPGDLDGDRSRDSGNLEFWKPNMMVLNIMPNQAFRIHALCVPAEENHVRTPCRWRRGPGPLAAQRSRSSRRG